MSEVVPQQLNVLGRRSTKVGREPLVSEGKILRFLRFGGDLLFAEDALKLGFFGRSFLARRGGGGTLFIGSAEGTRKLNIFLEQRNNTSRIHVAISPCNSENPVVNMELDLLEGKGELGENKK